MGLSDIRVEDGEQLARMILSERHVRRERDKVTAKPEAFLPYKHVDLSVIRHRDLSESELWEVGRDVSAKREVGDPFGRKFPLLGRGDFFARDARAQNLDAVPAEGPELPRNHADIIGWPSEKPAQMLRAVKIAAAASFVETPSKT